MSYRPSAKLRARIGFEKVCDCIERDLKKQQPKKPPVKGFRAEFLERYKLEGYGLAKEAINAKFGKEIYDDETLKKWIEEEEL